MIEQEFLPLSPEELKRKLDENFGILIEEMERQNPQPDELEQAGYRKLPEETMARISPLVQTVAGFGANKSIQGAYQGAVKLVVPPNLPDGARKTMLKQLGDGIFGFSYKDPKTGNFVGNAGYQNFDLKKVDVTQAAYGVFSLASVVTGQYFMQRIDKKLIEVQKTNSSILEYLELDKKSEFVARDTLLEETRENLDSIKNNQMQLQMHLNSIHEFRKAALADITFYLEQIQKNRDALQEPSKDKRKVRKEKVGAFSTDMNAYRMTLRQYGMATLLEVALSENMDKSYLGNIKDELAQRQEEFDVCYGVTQNELQKYIGAIEVSQLTKFLGSASRAYMNLVQRFVGARSIFGDVVLPTNVLASLLLIGATDFLDSVAEKERGELHEDAVKQLSEFGKPHQLQDFIDIMQEMQSPTEFVVSEDGIYYKPAQQMPQTQTA